MSTPCATIEVVSSVEGLTEEKDPYASVVLELATFDFESSVDCIRSPLCFSLASFSFCSLQERLVDWRSHETCQGVSIRLGALWRLSWTDDDGGERRGRGRVVGVSGVSGVSGHGRGE